MNKKRFLKSILATSALAAALAPGAALAAIKTTGGNETLSANGTWSGAAAPVTGDAIVYDANARTLNLNVANFNVVAVDINGKAPGTITVSEDATLGSVGDIATGGTAAPVTFAAAKTLTLSGTSGAVTAGNIAANTYTGLGDIDFNNNAGTLVLSATGATIADVDDTGGANNGTLTISNYNTVGAIGGTNALKAVNITAAAVAGKTTTLGATKAQTMNISGSTTVTAAGITAAGVAGTDYALKTGAGLLTLTGASDIGATKGTLNIGSGGITTNQNLTIGAAGTEGTGQLEFTANKTLKVSGDYAATGDILATAANVVVDANLAAANVTRTFSAPFKTSDNTKTLTFTNAGGAAGTVHITKDIGENDANKKYANVILTGANDKVKLGTDVDVYTTALTLTNAASNLVLADKAIVHGSITPGNGVGVVTVTGASAAAGSKEMLLDTATNGPLAEMNFDAGATNSTITLGTASGADTEHKINKLVYSDTSTNDNSGLVVDLSNFNGKRTYTLTTGAAAASTTASTSGGMLKFVNNTYASNVKVKLGNDLGTAANKLNLIEADGQVLQFEGVGGAKNLHTSTLKASEVTLNQVNLGAYTLLDTKKLTVTGNNSSILANSVLKEGTELHFATNNSLTLADDVNFNGSVTTAAGTGTLVLGKGTNAVSSVGTSAKILPLVTLNAANGTTTTIKSSGARADHYVTKYNLANASTLDFEGNLYGSIDAAGAGTTLVLSGGKITKSVGTTTAMAVKVNTTETVVIGSDTAAGHDFKATTVQFDKNGTIELSDKATGALAFTTVKTAAHGTGSLVFNGQAVTTAGDVGETAKYLKSVTIANSGSLTVTGGDDYFVQNTYSGTGNNNLTFAAATVATDANFGTADGRFNQTTVTAGNVAANSLYSKDLTITAGKLTAKVVDTTNAVAGAAGTIELLDGGRATHTSGAKLTAGNVVTLGSASLSGNIDGTLNLQGAKSDKVVNFAGDTITGAVTADASTLVLAQTTAFNGGYAGTNATLDMGGNDVTSTHANGITFSGDSVLVIKPGAQIQSDVIELATATDTLELKIRGGLKGNTTLFTKADGTTAQAPTIAATGTAITDANLKIDLAKNPFYSSVKHNAGVITVEGQKDIAKAATQAILANKNAKSFVQQIVNYVNASGESDAVIGQVMDKYSDMSDAERTEFATRAAERQDASGVVALGAVDQAGFESNARMAPTFVAAADAGVAAGDAADKYGVFVKGSFGNATQKFRKDTSGYKSNNYGAFVGVDAAVTDNVSVGVLAGYSSSKIKHKDVKAGDKTKANSITFGVFGSYDFGNNYFMQANAAVAQTTVKATSKRIVGAGQTATARGKYDVMAYNAEVRGGYKFSFDNSALVPTAGLRFSRLGDTSYTETGAGLFNVKHAGKARNGLDAVAGVMLTTTLDMDGMVLQPEVHMNVDYRLSNTAPKADYNLDTSGVKFHYTGAKPAKFGYNFGASVMAQNDNMEYGAGYDARISDKYLGHQGSVKVRLNF